jgi:hypothetical protein
LINGFDLRIWFKGSGKTGVVILIVYG